MEDIKNFSPEELEKEFVLSGDKPFHARQVFSWIYKRGVFDFEYMSDIPCALRERLSARFYILGADIIKTIESKDKTFKVLLHLKDGNHIEAVVIPEKERVTGCISSQVGCKFGCVFCASGALGFKRNLTVGEIIEEVLYLKDKSFDNKLTHLVFMGTGEPLDNYDNVMKAIRILNSSRGLNIGSRRITISTSGIIPGIKRLSCEKMQLELSVSLHAASDELRSRIMPINRKYPLAELIKACREYSAETNRQVTFEYTLIKGVNSSLEEAGNLCRLLEGFKLAKVNLIPSNYVKEAHFKPADEKSIFLFKDYLSKNNLRVTLRRERGADINAACGQLRLSYAKN